MIARVGHVSAREKAGGLVACPTFSSATLTMPSVDRLIS